ncbi:MAG: NADP-dependent oxidoreductase, partial [Maribacter sp.]
MNKSINLKQRPVGTPTLSDFEFEELDDNLTISDGEILLEANYISVDPYLRGRMSDAKSYVPPFKVGEPIS